MTAYVATKNVGKLREMRAIFSYHALELATYAGYADVAETADSYVGNALLKARALCAQLRESGIDAPVLADDSGLEVFALDGRPGVYSARYAGVQTGWPQRRATLLEEMRGVPAAQRGARFVCAMALILPAHRELTVLETVDGSIVTQERGTGGFGYDPIFFYPPRDCTFAELTEEEKNQLSHRRRAADAVLAAWSGRV